MSSRPHVLLNMVAQGYCILEALDDVELSAPSNCYQPLEFKTIAYNTRNQTARIHRWLRTLHGYLRPSGGNLPASHPAGPATPNGDRSTRVQDENCPARLQHLGHVLSCSSSTVALRHTLGPESYALKWPQNSVPLGGMQRLSAPKR